MKYRNIKFLFYLYISVFIQYTCTQHQLPDNEIIEKTHYNYVGYQNPNVVIGQSDKLCNDSPQIRYTGLVRGDIIQLTIDARSVAIPKVKAYQPHSNDSIVLKGKKVPIRFARYMQMEKYITQKHRDTGTFPVIRYIYRNGKPYGWLAGKGDSLYWPVNTISGKELDTTAIMNPDNYKVLFSASNGDSIGLTPECIYRKSKPHLRARFGPRWQADYGQRHEIFIKLPQKLPQNQSIILKLQNTGCNPKKIKFLTDYKRLRSEAIHVNQAGFLPNQPVKIAFLSNWLGSGGATAYSNIDSFQVIDSKTSTVKYQGKINLISSKDETEFETSRFGADNYNGTDIYEMDFSAFSDTGTFKIAIKGIGCSFPFTIQQNIWEKLFSIQMEGFYTQRSGIAIGEPFSKYTRPLNHHPDVGFDFYICNRKKFYNDNLYSEAEANEWNPFSRVMRSINFDSINNNAWGGWMDAADYDRRNKHFFAVHKMLDLFNSNPSFFSNYKLNIPEANNNIPDILDEALWCTELWRRTQEANGSAILGIESVMHPLPGECSYIESLPYGVIPGNAYDAYYYTSVAAHVAKILKPYNDSLATLYKNSAIKAYKWAVKNETNHLYKKTSSDELKLSKALAALFLYQLLDDSIYIPVIENFIAATMEKNINCGTMNKDELFLIIKVVTSNKCKELPEYNKLKQFVIYNAEQLLNNSKSIAYGEFGLFDINPWLYETIGSYLIIAAHQISENPKFLQALLRVSQYGLGMNPQNAAFTSGIGIRHTIPWDDEAEFQGIKYANGIPVFGPHLIERNGKLPENAFLWCHKRIGEIQKFVYPSFLEWPVRETYFEMIKLANINEFTIHQNMTNQMYRWGYIAQHYHKEIKNKAL